VPLSIDSSNTVILAAGLEACDASKGKPMVNSVSLERLEAVGIAANFEACVIGSATGETRMPDTVEERLANIALLSEELDKAGFAKEDIYLDPLVFPVSVDPQNGKKVLDAIKALRDRYGAAIHFAPGLSNISFGMPKRKLINQVFTWLARKNGADGGIVDPIQINSAALDAMDPEAESFRLARELLLGQDEFGMNFISASREGRL
jgi:5-methyltetrahydrofolate--homocysteine methyltransferase